MHAMIDWIVQSVEGLGYLGIFFLMFLESSFFPFPSEVVMIPAGYLAYQGQMSLPIAIAAGILGSVAGAVFNYYLAKHFGRGVLVRYGRYFFFSESTMEKMERFFQQHGHISTFSGRLIPGVRQYISLPAGIARMDLRIFCIFTALGAGIWVAILAFLGYFIGENQELISAYLHQITLGVVLLLMLIGWLYYRRHKRVSAQQ